MLIADLLRHKGPTVVTMPPEGLVTELVALLSARKIGAVVVARGDEIVGIVSERDVVRRLNDQGAAVLSATVAELMTADVINCAPTDSIDQIAEAMTEQRIRHMPVVVDGKLAGIVTIGDVVAARMRQLEQDRGQLENYITRG